MNDTDREWSEKEEGAIQALMDVAWHDTAFEISDYEGAVSRFDNWREIVSEADRRWYEEFEESVDREAEEEDNE